MLWIPLLSIALIPLLLRRWVQNRDEVTALSIYSISILSFCWGFIIAPMPLQVSIELLALGWFSQYRWTHRSGSDELRS